MSNSKGQEVNSALAPGASNGMEKSLESLRKAMEQYAIAADKSRQQQEAEAKRRTFFQIMKLNPPTFKGSLDPMEAENWIQDMKQIFDVLRSTDEQKVTYATFLLRGEARNWWEFTKTGFSEPVTWAMFKDAFLTCYFPEVYRNQKEEEFLKLKQGNMTVTEYDHKFIGLCRFAPYVVSDKDAMVRYFMRGLKPSIRVELCACDLTEYRALVNKALLVESCSEEIQQAREQKRRRHNGPERIIYSILSLE